MTPARPGIDLVVLVPDKQMEATVRSLLLRRQSLGLQDFHAEFLVHPHRDPGCRGESAGLLSVYLTRARYALVLFDREGCGEEHLARETLETNLQATLGTAGWSDRCAAIVIDPELEVWIWSDSPAVDEVLGWTGAVPSLRQWLAGEGHLCAGQLKPTRPKEALIAAMRLKRKRQSAALFADLAARISVGRCTDPAFRKLKAVLANWFPARETGGS